MHDCIFCKIINKEIPSEPVLDTENLIVLKDIAPKAPTHLLIIPKRHIADIREFTDADKDLAGELLLAAQQLSQQLDNVPFRLVVNNGHQAGQRVFHSHIHFLAGKELPEF